MNTDYDNFQLDWMMEHDHSIDDIIAEIDERDEYISMGLSDAYRQWVADGGFQDDGIWPSEDEFLYSEFLYSEYDHAPKSNSPSVICYKVEDGVLHLSDTRRDGYETFDTGDRSHKRPWTDNPDITKVVIEEPIHPRSCAHMFAGLKSLTEIEGLSNIDTSAVANMRAMFADCPSLTSLDLSNWDTSHVTNMRDMFEGCRSLESLDLSTFDTSHVTDMSHMFEYCHSLTSLDLSTFDTSKVTNMRDMFEGCHSLRSLDLSTFDTSHVTDMSHMFQNCRSLTALDLSTFDTSKVTNMACMFGGCYSLKSLDVSSFDTSRVTDMSDMFGYCRSLESLDVSSFDTGTVTDMSGMFVYCKSLKSLDPSGWDTSKVANMRNMFLGCTSLETVTTNDERIIGRFPAIIHYKVEDGILHLSDTRRDGYEPFDTSGQTGVAWPWESNTTVTKVVIDEPIHLTSDCAFMFSGLKNLTSIEGLGNLDTSHVTTMSYMFDGCESLTEIEGLENLDTSNVLRMSEMFLDCVSLKSLNLGGWDTGRVKDMEDMFENCRSLKSLDLSGWDTSHFTYSLAMLGMFYKCTSLETVTTNDEGIISEVPTRTKVVEPTARADKTVMPSLGDAIGQAASACRAADEGHTGHSGHDPR